MTDKPIDLDSHRGMKAQSATDQRRLKPGIEANEAALRRQQGEIEARLLSAPAENWPQAAAKARYLLELFAEQCGLGDARRQKLIAAVLADFDRLTRG